MWKTLSQRILSNSTTSGGGVFHVRKTQIPYRYLLERKETTHEHFLRNQQDVYVIPTSPRNTLETVQNVLWCFRHHKSFVLLPHELKTEFEYVLDSTPNQDKPFVGFFTSGTTSVHRSKLITLPHDVLEQHLHQLDQHIPVSAFHSRDLSFAMLPWNHCYGFVCELLFGMYRNASIALPVSRDRKQWMRELRGYSPTILFTVPYVLEKIHERIRPYGNHVSATILNRAIVGGRLEKITVGGAPCQPWLLEDLQKYLNVSIYQGYGMTECSPMIALNIPGQNKIGSVGKLLPEIHLEDPARSFKETREIIVRGPNVLGGRWSTQDEGYLDKDGFLYLSGRLSEMIKLRNGKFWSIEQFDFQLCNLLKHNDFSYGTPPPPPGVEWVEWDSSNSVVVSKQPPCTTTHFRVQQTVFLPEINRLCVFVRESSSVSWTPLSKTTPSQEIMRTAEMLLPRELFEKNPQLILFRLSSVHNGGLLPSEILTPKMTLRRRKLQQFLEEKK